MAFPEFLRGFVIGGGEDGLVGFLVCSFDPQQENVDGIIVATRCAFIPDECFLAQGMGVSRKSSLNQTSILTTNCESTSRSVLS